MQTNIDQNYTNELYTINFVNKANVFAFFAFVCVRCLKVIHLNGFTSVRVTYLYIVIKKRFNKLSLGLTHVLFHFNSSM